MPAPMYIPLLPTLGAKGVFTLTAPFDTVIGSNEIYECKSIRSIDEFFSEGLDPKQDYYTAYGLNEQEFAYDHTNSVSIVGLESESGDWVYVPARYVSSYPRIDGIKYRAITLSVALPIMPVDADLSTLKDMIANISEDYIGVDGIIVKEIESSRPVSVSPTLHALTRDSRLTSSRVGNFYTLYKQQEAVVVAQQNKIAELEQFIIDHLNLP